MKRLEIEIGRVGQFPFDRKGAARGEILRRLAEGTHSDRPPARMGGLDIGELVGLRYDAGYKALVATVDLVELADFPAAAAASGRQPQRHEDPRASGKIFLAAARRAGFSRARFEDLIPNPALLVKFSDIAVEFSGDPAEPRVQALVFCSSSDSEVNLAAAAREHRGTFQLMSRGGKEGLLDRGAVSEDERFAFRYSDTDWRVKSYMLAHRGVGYTEALELVGGSG